MPQLVKGGKFIYGLSRIGVDGSIFIPPEAMQEYGYSNGERVIGISGSRTSGGFGLTKKNILEKSALSVLIKELPELATYQIPEGIAITNKGRLFFWTVIRDNGCVRIPLPTLSRYYLETGSFLAVGRGSYLSIDFIARGPILEEALKYPGLAVFGK